MNLLFKSITIERFRSFIDGATLSFDSAGNGLYFLKGKNKTASALGSNGAGKSSVIDSLMWCLYGKTVQGLKNPDVIPWTGKGQTKVSVHIKIDDKDYTITRTIGPNLLTINGEEAGQEYVNQLISIPFEIIPYTIILGQRQPLFFDLTASEKLKLFNEVLQLDRWDQRSEYVANLSKSLESEITTKQFELDSALNAHKQALSDFTSLKQQSTEWENKRTERLASAENDKKTLQGQIASVMNERDTADLKLDRALTELKAIKSALDKLRNDERAATNTANKANREFHSLNFEKERLIKESCEVVDKGLCPTCNQPLTDKKHVKQLQLATKKKLTELQIEIDKAVKVVKITEKAYEEIESAIDIHLQAKDQFEHDAEQARDILDRLNLRIAQWQEGIKAIEIQYEDSSRLSNPYTEQLQILRRRRDQNKSLAEAAEKVIKEKTQYNERVKFWVKGFKDCKLLIVEEILQELSLTTNSMLEQFGLMGWKIEYDVERETKSKTISRGLNIVVLSPNNKNAVKWEVWSGGEGQRLRLIGSEALSSVLLNHVGVSVNLAIYDEPTNGLSKEGIYDLVELLAERAKQTKRAIWLVDQHAVESAKFTQVVEVTKNKDGSMLAIV